MKKILGFAGAIALSIIPTPSFSEGLKQNFKGCTYPSCSRCQNEEELMECRGDKLLMDEMRDMNSYLRFKHHYEVDVLD